jgi:hypothetical protein
MGAAWGKLRIGQNRYAEGGHRFRRWRVVVGEGECGKPRDRSAETLHEATDLRDDSKAGVRAELRGQVTSPQLSFADYCTEEILQEDVVHIMVGDLQRIWEYPKEGYMIEQAVLGEVKDAWKALVGVGFDRRLN